ncbi:MULTISPECIES: helix-turn-helix domain-containing protein [Aeribacillus]|uniref:HTH cro/C1-type domain-containing protein n=1 Tax=Aeribacillus pallidus TaxID=33936 RepID=A0A165WR72_9BACI|nr:MULTISPECIES: helix-turn-helix transcriptional regulator [Aeribacillus]KZN95226.1 hypothetical protein AZI98_14570 [Aeribacillus pallidus]MED0704109.1 helix-turn-helix transcriptional regulator [Aeribacillus composti]MED1441263.1 helix-turn-helix transcriptional regulator [Aeribacillus composti]
MDAQQKFQMNMKFFRKEKGWTQKQLAEKLNMTRSVISKLETGVQQPSLEQLVSISEALEISIDHLVGQGGTPSMLAEVLEPYRSEKHLEEVIDFLIKHPNLYDAIKKLAKTNHNQQQLSQYVATMIHELLKIE